MRVLICEDNVLLREGIGRLLEDAGHEIAASLPDATGLADAVTEQAPDVAVLDVRLPPTFTDEGIRAAIALRGQHPDLRVLVLSQYVEERYASDLIAENKGGFGYLLKDRVADVDDFLDAANEVAQGGTVLDPEVVGQILVRSRKQQGLAMLTGREREVLELMAQGKSNSAIAGTLFLSAGAVEKHISNVFQKFGLIADSDENRRVLAVLKFLRG